MKKSIIHKALGVLLLATVVVGCSVRFSFSGASISPDVQTVKVEYIPNMAAMVAPILSPTLTDELILKIQQQTRLEFTNDDPDVLFQGEIVDYVNEPIAISGDEQAVENRLTIAVRVTFTNFVEPELSYSKSFTAYANFPSNEMLTSVESSLIPEICTQLVEDIFNAAFSNW